jgi:hypothetical protein
MPRTAAAPGAALIAVRPETPDRAWRRLCALHIADREDWIRYLAGDWAATRFAIRLLDGTTRVLHRDAITHAGGASTRRDEILPWLLGQAYAHGMPAAFDRIPAVPALYTAAEAASRLGITVQHLHLVTRAGRFTPLYTITQRIERRYFVAEIEAAHRPDDTGLHAAWQLIRDELPHAARLTHVPHTESPAPDPLPIPAQGRIPQRCLRAINIAEDRGWLTLEHYRDGDAFTITVPDCPPIALPVLAALPFIQGVADAHSAGDQVAYR